MMLPVKITRGAEKLLAQRFFCSRCYIVLLMALKANEILAGKRESNFHICCFFLVFELVTKSTYKRKMICFYL